MPSPKKFDSLDDFGAFIDQYPESDYGSSACYFHESRLVCEIHTKSGEVVGRWQSRPLSPGEQADYSRVMEEFVMERRKPSYGESAGRVCGVPDFGRFRFYKI